MPAKSSYQAFTVYKIFKSVRTWSATEQHALVLINNTLSCMVKNLTT